MHFNAEAQRTRRERRGKQDRVAFQDRGCGRRPSRSCKRIRISWRWIRPIARKSGNADAAVSC